MIDQIKIENFTAFKGLHVDFSPKINVIIGENGTGKTHILKAAYALCTACHPLKDKNKVSTKEVEDAITSRLVGVFRPLDDKLASMKHRETKGNALLSAKFSFDKIISISFSSRSKKVKLEGDKDYECYSCESVFVPTKEVLSLLQGVTDESSDRTTIAALFDDSYIDLCHLLLKSPSSDHSGKVDIDPRYGTIFPTLTNAIGGKYIFEKGHQRFLRGEYIERRVKKQHKLGDKTETVFKVSGGEISNNMTAEGFRKLGVLQQLLSNKSLDPGASGPLFWDEPEANMNPKLMGLLVKILLDLSRNGQQIILATHDYVLLKWFDLLKDEDKEDHIRFHVLYNDEETGEINIRSTDDYLKISDNSISDTFAELYDKDVVRALEDI